MSGSFQIREMTIKDYDEVYRLRSNTEGLYLNQNDERQGIELCLKRNPGLSLVAYSGGEIYGAVLCGHDGHWGIIRHLAVRENLRGLGIRSQLVKRCEERLKELGCPSIVAFVEVGNEIAERFWVHWGLIRYNALPMGKPLKSVPSEDKPS